MMARVVVVVFAGAVASAQPLIERPPAGRISRGSVSQMAADMASRGSIVAVRARRTRVVRLVTPADALALGFSASELESFGVFAHGGELANAVVGFARDAAANVLPGAEVRLRDLQRGQLVAHARTGPGGQFGFPGLPTGTYLVELLTPDGRTAAASDAVSVASGEVAQTIVQLPSTTRSFGAWLGHATTSAVSAAAGTGVLALEPAPSVSPES